MKQITISLLLLMVCSTVFSQTNSAIGVYSEGGYFFPKSSPGNDIENNLATGGGIFAAYYFAPKFSVSLQTGYRYKSNKINYTIKIGEGTTGGYDPNGSIYETIKLNFKQHYFVVPAKLSYLLSENLFAAAGIEAGWLLNYEAVDKKPEYNLLLEVGINIGTKLKASLNYTQGLHDQKFGPLTYEGENYGQAYKNRMLMLNLSYAIFDFKK